jgi:hypothetical protein
MSSQLLVVNLLCDVAPLACDCRIIITVKSTLRIWVNLTDKEHFDVVFHRIDLCIVEPRSNLQCVPWSLGFDLDGVFAEGRFAVDVCRRAVLGEYDCMVISFDAFLAGTLFFVRRDST